MRIVIALLFAFAMMPHAAMANVVASKIMGYAVLAPPTASGGANQGIIIGSVCTSENPRGLA